jgi:hypothetical protein
LLPLVNTAFLPTPFFEGTGIIGVFVIILASFLVRFSFSLADEEATGSELKSAVELELEINKHELAALRLQLEQIAAEEKGREQ